MYFPGSKKYKAVYGKTYSQVKEKLHTLNMENVAPDKVCSLCFSEIMVLWLNAAKSRIKESSYYSYKSKFDTHIADYFWNTKYSKMSAVDISRFADEKISSGLSAKYVSDMVAMMKSAAKWCEQTQGYKNRIVSAVSPKIKRRELDLLDNADRQRLQKYLINHDSDTDTGIYLAMYTGIRIGELCALKWSDIDFDNNILHISKTVQRISSPNGKSKTTVKVTTPKTENAIREIPLPPFLASYLKKSVRNDDTYILSGSHKIVEPRCLSYRFKSILKKANVPPIKFHSLRHTFATDCLQTGFDVKTLSEILGHSDSETTMRFYIHSSMERKQACMSLLVPLAKIS